MKFVRLLSCVLLLLCALPDRSVADVTNYESFEGDTVVFGGIQETSTTSDGAVYGAPNGSGDAISFTPFGFSGFSDGELAFQEGRLSVDLTANDGYLIQSIEILEESSFFMFGDDSMVMSNMLGVANADGVLYSDSTSNEMHGNNFAGGNSFQSGFQIELPDVQSATFVLDSQIFAAALGEFDLASISKDALVVRVTTVPVSGVPEPTTTGLLMVLGIGFVSRRSSRSV